MHSVDSTVEAAKHLLAARFGGSPELTHPEDLGGSGNALVLRCRVSPIPFLQERTVVVKQLPPAEPGRDELTPDGLALLREVVAYQYTNTLTEKSRPGPLLLAYDLEQRLLILSDAGDGTSFTDVLTLQGEEERRLAVRKLGRALGHMHATTCGGAESYRTLLRRQCQKLHISPETVMETDIDIAALIRQGVELVRSNGLDVDETVEHYAEEAAHRQSRTDLRAFTPFDMTPDNIMLTKHVVFLDYEWASFRDVAFDVACVVAGFPQDNSTPALTTEETDEFVAAWRAEIASTWPETRDDKSLHDAMMSALIGWAFLSLMMFYYGRSTEEQLVRDENGQPTPTVTSLRHLPADQLQDLATTVDAILRYSREHKYPRFASVEKFAQKLLRILGNLEAHPLTRHG
ncbi:phosphotransferase [Corynebacterium falsenii]